MVQVLMLSKWHVHAEGYARFINSQPDAKVTCVWDEDAARGKKWADEMGVDFEADMDKALARADVNAVVVGTPTSEHKKVMTAAAKAGKHIFTEKVLATTVADCNAIAEAVKKNGVKFCISYPHLTLPLFQYLKQAIDEGWLGKIHYFRYRKAHNGSLAGWLPDYWYDMEKAGGGAMMDLGCHPMYIASDLLGKPKRVTSMFNTNCCPAPADDNAVSVVEFENNAIAVLETSFISPFNGDCVELLGTEGAIVAIGDEVKVRSNKLFDGGWFIPAKMPAELPPALRQWIDGIERDTKIPFDLEKAIALTELQENAYKSHEGQTIVTI